MSIQRRSGMYWLAIILLGLLIGTIAFGISVAVIRMM